jgi:membrane protein YdbS with pleckstrin-like domain
MARKPRAVPDGPATPGLWSFVLSTLLAALTIVAMVVALFLGLPDPVVWAFLGLFVLGLVAALVLDVVEAVRHRAGAWRVLWAGVSSPFRYTFGWLRLLPTF